MVYENAHCSGIFNVGTGNNYTYNTLADYVIDWFEQNLNLTPSKQYRVPGKFKRFIPKLYQSRPWGSPEYWLRQTV